MKNEIAILIAAGLGRRMMPLTKEIAKPLIKIHGKSMIETVIEGLESRGIKHIYVVVGYKKEQFEFLPLKYGNITLVENIEYLTKNNISSLHAVCDVIGKENCFICEADLYVSDSSIFQAELSHSCYYGKMVEGHSEDWVFDLNENGKVIRIGMGGDDVYNMAGISYFLAEDAKKIADAINEACRNPGHEELYWDEIVNRQLENIDLYIYSVRADQIVEIDSVSELIAVDSVYRTYKQGSALCE